MKTLLAVHLIGLVSVIGFGQPLDTLWTHRYGGLRDQLVCAAQQTADSGFILAGSTDYTIGGFTNIWILKTSATGDSLWSRSYGTPYGDGARAVLQTEDGGYLIAGYRADNILKAFVMKTDADGDSLWGFVVESRQVGGLFTSIIRLADNNYLVTGYNWENGTRPISLKVTQSGDIIWMRSYIVPFSGNPVSAIALPDSGGLMVGRITSGWCNTVAIRFDSRGDTLWTRRYRQIMDNHTYTELPTGDGGFLLVGSATLWPDTMVDDRNGLVMKTDSSGAVQWQRGYNRTFWDELNSAAPISSGGYVLVGSTHLSRAQSRDWWIVRINDQGDTTWTHTYGGTREDTARVILPTFDGNFLIAGTRTFADTCWRDFYLMKMHAETPSATPSVSLHPTDFALSAYPNPFNPSTQIAFDLPSAGLATVSVFDLLGQHVALLHNGPLAAGKHRLTFDGQRFSSGLYFIQLETPAARQTLKLVLMK